MLTIRMNPPPAPHQKALTPAPAVAAVDASGKRLVTDEDIGSKVMITDKGIGILRWIGKADFVGKGKMSIFCGIELDASIAGGGTGTVASKAYFQCAPGRAVFTTRKKVTLISDADNDGSGGRVNGDGGSAEAGRSIGSPSKPSVAKEVVKRRVAKLRTAHKGATTKIAPASSAAMLKKSARVWLPDDEQVWIEATVTDAVAGLVTITTDSTGAQLTINAAKPTPTATTPLMRNPDMLLGISDLTNLSYLHEAAVLENLQMRFKSTNEIYTYCGIVLVAINPYTSLPLYTPEVIEQYRGKYIGELEPHIFAVAEDAYSCLFRDQRNQSIIVSGESGAGKTVNAKLVMRYFATVGGASDETQIEKRILASNPVMESLGNSKTTRNDNSSRFGKYIEIAFNKRRQIKGAKMRTFLLEKSRVVHQAATERNYHIFYQLCAASDEWVGTELELGAADQFFLLNQGGEPSISQVDDAEEFNETKEAMATLGITSDAQQLIFRVLASLLHLGNVELLATDDGEGATVPKADFHLSAAAQLLGVELAELVQWITHRKIVLNREEIIKPLRVQEAMQSCHALTKNMYASLFDWVVARLNLELAGGKPKKSDKFIGVLDIYGFETFKVNSFEQFCINYANEKLQQIFNQHIFKLEQEEYKKEEIEWSFIDFYDNQPCIDLIEHRTGVIALLDEECRIPKGSDVSWVAKMDDRLNWHEHFQKARLSNSGFLVKHYAGTVEYEAHGFLEKNKDTFSEEQKCLLRGSSIQFVSAMFKAPVPPKPDVKVDGSGRRSGSMVRQSRPTVAHQFHGSLDSLMATLTLTQTHYVRCIKPNDNKKPFEFDRKRCVEQVRACGVLETIRISAAGFPSRWSYIDFLSRYNILGKSYEIEGASERAACEHILVPLITEEDKFQFGVTKIFFRAGQIAQLEMMREERLGNAALMIQTHWKGWRTRKAYQQLRSSVISMQCHIRGWLAREVLQRMREHAAAVAIQARFRAWKVMKTYQHGRAAAIKIQAVWRGTMARRKLRAGSGVRLAIAALQNNFDIARKLLKSLQHEVRSVSGVHQRSELQKEMTGGLRAQLTTLEKCSATAYSEVRLLTDDLDAAVLAGSGSARRGSVSGGLDKTRSEVDVLTATLKAGTSSMASLIDGGIAADDSALTKPALTKARKLLTQARTLLAPGADSPDVSSNRRASIGGGLSTPNTQAAAGGKAAAAAPPPPGTGDGLGSPKDTDHLRGMVMDYFQTHKGASQAAMKDHLLAMVRKGAANK
jgi:myosin-5